MKFILNDESKANMYGFRILNAGIDLNRFKANPVILNTHYSNIPDVVGRWENIQIEGSQLTADAVFDKDDEDAAKIAGKVERGFIKGASMGLSSIEPSNFERQPDGSYILKKCELMEASICAIPSNANALKLYAVVDGAQKVIEDTDIRLMLDSEETQFKSNISNMIKLAYAVLQALSLDPSQTELPQEKIDGAILKLKADLDAAQAKVKSFEDKEQQARLAASTQLVEDALKAGKINASQKDNFLKLAANNFELAKSTLDAIPAKNSYADKVKSNLSGNESEVKTADDFQKLDLKAQLEFKESYPDQYKKLFS